MILSGGTGFIGTPLRRRLLEKGHQVTLLTRNPSSVKTEGDRLKAALWDGKNSGAWTAEVDGAGAIINLAGEPIVAKRWSKKQKERILTSRLDATRAIVSAVAKATQKPKVLVNASAVGFYGDAPEGEVTESSPAGNDFLAGICKRWEEEAQRAQAHGVRVVRLRTGIVLEKGGGALQKMLLPFKLFVGGPLGSGRQWLPWVHREDVIGAILFVLENQSVSGAINMTAPTPVTMKQFCTTLGTVMDRPSWAPVPSFVLKIVLGEMSEVVLTGQKAIPKKLREAGYPFLFPKLEEALVGILRTPPRK